MQRAPWSLPSQLTRALFPEDPRALSGGSPVPWDWRRFSRPSPWGEPSQVQSFHTWVFDPGLDYFPPAFGGLICRINPICHIGCGKNIQDTTQYKEVFKMVYFLWHLLCVNTRLKGSVLYKCGKAVETNVSLVMML